jgi:hypothetical protein
MQVRDLGGVTRGTPASTYGDGRYDVFAVSPYGNLYQKTYYPGGPWGRWHRVASGFAAGVSAVRAGDRYHVFGRDAAGHLRQAIWNGQAWHVQRLDGVFRGTPASTYRDGRYDVFAVSPGGHLYQKTYRAGSWHPWHEVAARPPRLGRSGWRPGIRGYGQVRPKEIFNDGDPTSLVTDITWQSWGGARAVGNGTSLYYSETVSGGTEQAARVVAFDPGTCAGEPSYNRVTWFFPQHGQRFPGSFAFNTCTGEHIPVK